MRTAVVSAMREELQALMADMADARREMVAGREFLVGRIHGHEVVAVLSRIGKVAAATTATALVERFAVDQVLFTGAAGGIAEGVAVGDVVIARAFLQHDMDASPLFPRHEVPLYGRALFPTDEALSLRLGRAARDALATPDRTLGEAVVREFALQAPKVHEGLIASGDRFVSTTQESVALRAARPDLLAVEMEGAAVAQVCHDYGLPFAAVRTVSDRADDAAHVDFLRFIQQVASRYSHAVIDRFFRDQA